MNVSAGGATALFLLLAVASVIDIIWFRIPNVLVAVLAASGFAAAAQSYGMVIAFGRAGGMIALLLGTGIVAEAYRQRTGVTPIGGGDLKLLAAVGLWVETISLAPIITIAATAAVCVTIAGSALGRPLSRHTKIPFAPYISVGTAVVWLAESTWERSWYQLDSM